GGGIFLGALLVAAIVTYATGKSETEASKALGLDLKTVSRRVDVNALAPTGDNPPFKSEKEKDEAILKAMGEFRASHKGSRAGAGASLLVAQASLRLGRLDEAL